MSCTLECFNYNIISCTLFENKIIKQSTHYFEKYEFQFILMMVKLRILIRFKSAAFLRMSRGSYNLLSYKEMYILKIF